jgi:hypothetical protein
VQSRRIDGFGFQLCLSTNGNPDKNYRADEACFKVR